MKKISAKKGILIFYGFDLLLVLILIVSFLPFNRRNVPETMDSALLNVNRIPEIARFTVVATNGDGERVMMTVQKHDSVWLGTDSTSRNTYLWPVDSQLVANMFSVAAQGVRLYTKAQSASSWKSLQIDDEQACVLTFYDKSDSIVSSLFFGIEDGLTQRIAVRTWTDQTVYEVDNAISDYLNADEAFWSDPYLFPQCVTGYSRVQSDSLLRHGNILNIAPADHVKPVKTLHKDFENGARVVMAVYQRDDDYIVIPVFQAGPSFSAAEKNAIESINYRYSISGWTYSRLLEQEGINE